MSFHYFTSDEFQRRHKEHINSARWKAFRKQALEHYGYRCCVCGYGYTKRQSKWMLICDHKQYWKDGTVIFGHETFEDVRIVCNLHNNKGVRSDEQMKAVRSAYRAERILLWFCKLPWRLLTRVIGWLS